MLVLSRKKGESIVIGEFIEITVLSVENETIKLGISAPKHMDIYRKEIYETITLSNQAAVFDPEQLHRLINSSKKNEK